MSTLTRMSLTVFLLISCCSELLAGSSRSLSDRFTSTPIRPHSDLVNIRFSLLSGYLQAIHSGTIPSHAQGIDCPMFNNGSDQGFYIGGSLQWLFGSPVDASSGMSLRFLYESLPAVFSVPADTYPSRVSTSTSNGIVETSAIQTNSIDLASVGTELLVHFYALDGHVTLSVGPTAHMYVHTNMVQRLSLLDVNARFSNTEGYETEDFSRTLVLSRSEIESLNVFTAGLKGNISANIELNRIALHPHVGYQIRFASVSSEIDWHVSAIHIGLSISQVHSFGRD